MRDVITMDQSVMILAGEAELAGDMSIPEDAVGLVVFAHGSGSSRGSPRNRQVAGVLHQHRLATLLFDLLTAEEATIDDATRHLRFDIGFLGTRLIAATDWLTAQPVATGRAIGYFGASTGAAATLVAAANRPDVVRAVVSRGGRPDLAIPVLGTVRAPTLLIVGSADTEVISLNQRAFRELKSPKELVLVDGATHLFEEPGAMHQVATLAADWFERWLGGGNARGLSA